MAENIGIRKKFIPSKKTRMNGSAPVGPQSVSIPTVQAGFAIATSSIDSDQFSPNPQKKRNRQAFGNVEKLLTKSTNLPVLTEENNFEPRTAKRKIQINMTRQRESVTGRLFFNAAQ